jgi:hypothetical protein
MLWCPALLTPVCLLLCAVRQGALAASACILLVLVWTRLVLVWIRLVLVWIRLGSWAVCGCCCACLGGFGVVCLCRWFCSFAAAAELNCPLHQQECRVRFVSLCTEARSESGCGLAALDAACCGSGHLLCCQSLGVSRLGQSGRW